MNGTVIAVGKLKERYYREACEEYLKRLKLYGNYRLTELAEEKLPEDPAAAEIERGLLKEAEAVKKEIPKGAALIVCTPEGKLMSSEQLAEWMEKKKQSYSSFCFLIGSSNGIHGSLKNMAELKLSVSPMTFPHHLFRVMLLEQLYRAENIQAGGKYHK